MVLVVLMMLLGWAGWDLLVWRLAVHPRKGGADLREVGSRSAAQAAEGRDEKGGERMA